MNVWLALLHAQPSASEQQPKHPVVLSALSDTTSSAGEISNGMTQEQLSAVEHCTAQPQKLFLDENIHNRPEEHEDSWLYEQDNGKYKSCFQKMSTITEGDLRKRLGLLI